LRRQEEQARCQEQERQERRRQAQARLAVLAKTQTDESVLSQLRAAPLYNSTPYGERGCAQESSRGRAGRRKLIQIRFFPGGASLSAAWAGRCWRTSQRRALGGSCLRGSRKRSSAVRS
jgi:hypothetical protein